MSDNTTLNAGTGGDVIATDDIAGVKYQRVKVTFGADGVATDVSATDKLPVTGPVTDAQLRATAVPVVQNAVADAGNSSTAVLAGGATFTGAAFDVLDFDVTTVSIHASHASATDGLSLQWGPDGVNWDVIALSNLAAGEGRGWSMAQRGRYFRIVYTNGATLQTYFRLNVHHSPVGAAAVARTLGSTIDDDIFADITRAVLSARRPNGTYGNIQATAGGNLKVAVEEFDASLPAGTNNIGLVGLDAGANTIGTTLGPTLTKGTQGTTGYSVQELKDAGRNARAFMLDTHTAAPNAEALQTVVQWYGNAAVGGTTQPAVVPAGKTLRLTNWSLSTKSLNTVGSAVLRIRANTGGLVVIGSPLVWSAEVGSRAGATTVAMTGGMDQQTGTFPEGFEFPAGTGLGFTLAGYGPTGTLALQGVTRFQVYGYEY